MRFIFILFTVIVSAQSLIAAPDPDPKNLLDRPNNFALILSWKFMAGDKPEYGMPDHNDSKWRALSPYMIDWPVLQEEEKYKGNVWFRNQFYFNSSKPPAKGVGLFIPLTESGSQIFLNGHLIHASGAFHPDSKAGNPKNAPPELIPIPSDLLKYPGPNTIAIRTHEGDGSNGYVGDYFHLGEMEVVSHLWVRFIIHVVSLSFITIFLSLFYLFHYLQRPQEKYYLQFGLLNFCLGLWFLGYKGLIFYITDSRLVYIFATFSLAALVLVFLVNFLFTFFGFKSTVVQKLWVAFYSILAALALGEYLITGGIRFYYTNVFALFISSILILILYLLYLNYKAIRQNARFAWRILGGLFVFILSLAYSMPVFLGLYDGDSLINEGFIGMSLVFATILAKRFSDTMTQLEVTQAELKDVNENLEQKIRERTRLINEQNRKIGEQNKVFIRDLRLARRIQSTLLPEAPQLKEVDIYYHYHPTQMVGGDFIDIHYDPVQKQLGLFICDVTGHGVPAALLASMVKMTLRQWPEYIADPVGLLNHIQKSLKGNLEQHFITASACSINLQTGFLTMGNAGHPETILMRNDGELELFKPTGTVISDFIASPREALDTTLEKGNKIVLYTDGIVETRTRDEEILGREPFFDMLREHQDQSPLLMTHSILNKVNRYSTVENPTADDQTLLVLEYLGPTD